MHYYDLKTSQNNKGNKLIILILSNKIHLALNPNKVNVVS